MSDEKNSPADIKINCRQEIHTIILCEETQKSVLF